MTATTKPRRVNLATATAATRALVIGTTTTVKLWDSSRTGVVESVTGCRAVVRFPDGTWAYSLQRITVRGGDTQDPRVADARRTVTELTDGRTLTPLDMLRLGHAHRTIAQLVP